MQLRPLTTAGTMLITVLLFVSSGITHAHNITKILAKHPEYSTFNHYLSLTHLSSEVNRRTTITICAVDNAAMDELLSKHLSINTIKNILSLHVLLDYFGAKKLHQITNGTALAATMFQATGTAPGSAGRRRGWSRGRKAYLGNGVTGGTSFVMSDAKRALWDKVDESILLGVVPFPIDVPRLKELGVRGVITLNESYETLVPTSLYHVHRIDHLVIPTRDYCFAPSLHDICSVVGFIQGAFLNPSIFYCPNFNMIFR
ncbi:hypothetical protein K1719_026486 [Acacia pycnantha]|nr:hypothetical protein K1719_026486 [Acacia pycnantha]